MIILARFAPFIPDPGLLIWTLIFFTLFWILMSRFAFKPIINGLKKRENDIQDALDEAKKAKEEMSNLKAENQELLAKAQEERAKILKEAKEAKDSIITEAREKAKDEYKQLLNAAKEDIENQKMAAIVDLKNQVGNFAIEIAEQVLQKELSTKSKQEKFVTELVDKIELN